MADLTGMMQAAAGGAGGGANYIEDVFSTYLYTGNGAAQTITNSIDLSTKDGLVWIKSRSAATSNFLFDTKRGVTDEINSDTVNAEASLANSLTAFNADGFSINNATGIGVSSATYASWTFRKAAKFFDVVTYIGTGAAQNIAHNLGSVPGCIIAKNITSNGNWHVYHRSLGNGNVAYLNQDYPSDPADYWNNTTPTSAVFSVKSENSLSGQTYVAYLWAHNDGGFGDDGDQNVVTCGSYTGNGSSTGPIIDLGYEPQWLMTKRADGTSRWLMLDNLRGWANTTDNQQRLSANLATAEAADGSSIALQNTGFQLRDADPALNANGGSFIYIAIRRGPMKVPTDGSTLFAVDTWGGGPPAFTSGFPVDWAWMKPTTGGETGGYTRMLGANKLRLNLTNAETADGDAKFDYMNGWNPQTFTLSDYYSWMFKRAPGYMDVVSYTGTGANRTVTHNLAAVPELMIIKSRSTADGWPVYSATLGAVKRLLLSGIAAQDNEPTYFNSTSPTSSVFTVGTDSAVNGSGSTYVAYLFATLAGISKVGSYTGTGTTQAINCGFTTGARLILIKRTDDTGDWYYWDSVRGINAGNDPYLLINTAGSQVTGTDYIDASAAGFELTSTAPAAINANGGSFIFLAIS